jgi:cytochrome c oxidase assembly protein Cox11
MEDESNANDIRTITLSYTFFNTNEFKGATNTASLN